MELIAKFGKKIIDVHAPGFAVSVRGKTIHLLAVDYELTMHPFDAHRRDTSAVSLIQKITPIKCVETITVSSNVKKAYCPLGGSATVDGNTIHLAEHPIYVILELS